MLRSSLAFMLVAGLSSCHSAAPAPAPAPEPVASKIPRTEMEKEAGKAAEELAAMSLETIKAVNEGKEISPARLEEMKRVTQRSMNASYHQLKSMMGPEFRLKNGMTLDEMEKKNPNFDRLELILEIQPALMGNLSQRRKDLRQHSDELLQKSRSALKSIEEIDSPEAKARRERIELQNNTWEQYHAKTPELKSQANEVDVDAHRQVLLQKINAAGSVEVLLPLMKCNVSGTKGTRFLYWQIAINGDAELMRQLSGGPLHNRARAKMIDLLSSFTLDELDQAKTRIASQIATALNELKTQAAPELKGRIEEAYFVEFYIY